MFTGEASLTRSKLKVRLFLLFPLLVLILFLLNISLGSVHIPLSDLINITLGGQGDKSTWVNIVWQFRIPKALTAVLAGFGLALSGLQMQTLFRNPLAGPFVLGITSGASLGVATLVMAGSLIGGIINYSGVSSWLLVLAASGGAFLVFSLVMLVSTRIKDSMTLLVAGLMFGSATGAIVGIMQFFASAEQLQLYLIWTFGSLGGLTWDELKVLSIVIILGLALVITLMKPLNALLLGEEYAQSMGIPIKKSRIFIIISTSLLAGSITAFCGPIAFVGIAVPHLTRLMINTSDHKILLPAVGLTGAALLLICDTIAQLPGSQYILPINAVTSLVGAPVIIWIILKRKNISKSFAG